MCDNRSLNGVEDDLAGILISDYPTTTGDYYEYDAINGVWVVTTGGGGGGGITTITNVGSGQGLFKTIVGTNADFKSISGNFGVDVISGGPDDITIDLDTIIFTNEIRPQTGSTVGLNTFSLARLMGNGNVGDSVHMTQIDNVLIRAIGGATHTQQLLLLETSYDEDRHSISWTRSDGSTRTAMYIEPDTAGDNDFVISVGDNTDITLLTEAIKIKNASGNLVFPQVPNNNADTKLLVLDGSDNVEYRDVSSLPSSTNNLYDSDGAITVALRTVSGTGGLATLFFDDFAQIAFNATQYEIQNMPDAGVSMNYDVTMTGDFLDRRSPAATAASFFKSVTLAPAVTGVVEFADFDVSFGCHNLELYCAANNTNFSGAKSYKICTQDGYLSGQWTMVRPVSSSDADTGGEDYQLEARMTGTVLRLRLRRTYGTTAAAVRVRCNYTGNASATYTSLNNVIGGQPRLTAFSNLPNPNIIPIIGNASSTYPSPTFTWSGRTNVIIVASGSYISNPSGVATTLGISVNTNLLLTLQNQNQNNFERYTFSTEMVRVPQNILNYGTSANTITFAPVNMNVSTNRYSIMIYEYL